MTEAVEKGEGTPALAPFLSSKKARGQYRSLFTVDQLYKDHDDRTAVIVGSGTSLRGFDFTELNRDDLYTIVINDECFRNQEAYRPSMWIFNDENVLDRYRRHNVDRRITIVSRQVNLHNAIHRATKFGAVPDWVWRIHEYTTTKRWGWERNQLYMHRTTAAPALILAAKMGFKKVILLGIDFFTPPDAYYYSGETKARELPSRARSELGNGHYMEDRHLRMAMDLTHVHENLQLVQWPGQVIQTSLHSPLSCFPKMTWEEARHGTPD